MGASAVILGLLPIIVFALLDSFAGLKQALIGATVMAFLELGLSLWLTQSVDALTGISFLAVIVLAALSWRFKSGIIFKMQPAILSALFACILLGSWLWGMPLFVLFFNKYESLIPNSQLLRGQIPNLEQLLITLTITTGVFHLLHSALMYYLAKHPKRLWWVLGRSLIYYAGLATAALSARFLA